MTLTLTPTPTLNLNLNRAQLCAFGFRISFVLRHSSFVIRLLACTLLLAGCNFAPKYSRPSISTPAAFKEISPTNSTTTNIWKVAQPSDNVTRGAWWERFADPELNLLEDQVNISNQNIAAAFANFLAARAIVKESRAQLFPTLLTAPEVTRSRQRPLASSGSSPSTFTTYSLPFDATWQVDLWGRIRNTVSANASEAQATAADLESVRLTAHAELAVDYFQLRAQDALIQLYDATVAAYRESLELTKARFETGIASDEDVAQAETQLETAQANATNLGILRAQMEHAIAVLLGKPPSIFSIAAAPLSATPPAAPLTVPSELLERRPDIAAVERRVAEANSQIGVAKAAYFPALTLSASAGFESASLVNLPDWSSRVWSAGAGLTETIFDAGQRKATMQQYRAAFEKAVASYRQTVLTAFQQVEDDLASLRILARQIDQQDAAVKSSARYLGLATDRYKLGIDSFLNVITAQAVLLNNRQALVNLQMQQMTASVQLIEALGGGWDISQLPSPRQLLTNAP